MKKGERRKANKKANRARKPGHHKGKRHKNPLWLTSLDVKDMRKMVNQSIGFALIAALEIDFVGIMAMGDRWESHFMESGCRMFPC